MSAKIDKNKKVDIFNYLILYNFVVTQKSYKYLQGTFYILLLSVNSNCYHHHYWMARHFILPWVAVNNSVSFGATADIQTATGVIFKPSAGFFAVVSQNTICIKIPQRIYGGSLPFA